MSEVLLELQIDPTPQQADLLEKWIASYSESIQKFLYRGWKTSVLPKYAEAPLDLPSGARYQLLIDVWKIHNNLMDEFECPVLRLPTKKYSWIRTGDISIRGVKFKILGGKTISKDQQPALLTIFKKNGIWTAKMIVKNKKAI